MMQESHAALSNTNTSDPDGRTVNNSFGRASLAFTNCAQFTWIVQSYSRTTVDMCNTLMLRKSSLMPNSLQERRQQIVLKWRLSSFSLSCWCWYFRRPAWFMIWSSSWLFQHQGRMALFLGLGKGLRGAADVLLWELAVQSFTLCWVLGCAWT